MTKAAQAQRGKIKKLTNQNVQEFIEHTSYMTSEGKKDLSMDKIKKYLDRHMEDDARFKSIMKYNVPGMPTQEQAMSLGKDEFIESVEKGGQTIDDYETLVEIKSIKISSNKKKAFVQTTSTEMVTMPVPTENGGTENVPVEGESECNQILSLNRGVIQMYSAQCTTNIQFLDY